MDQEQKTFNQNTASTRREKAHINVGDEIVLNTRVRCLSVGPEMIQIGFTELHQQGHLPQEFTMWFPISDIRSAPLPKEKLPPEVPQ